MPPWPSRNRGGVAPCRGSRPGSTPRRRYDVRRRRRRLRRVDRSTAGAGRPARTRRRTSTAASTTTCGARRRCSASSCSSRRGPGDGADRRVHRLRPRPRLLRLLPALPRPGIMRATRVDRDETWQDDLSAVHLDPFSCCHYQPESRQPADRGDPGCRVLSATAVFATMGDPAAFRSGREFAAWLGLVPRHTGTGGRVRMLGISKSGDTYLRTLLIHGARSALVHGKLPSAWQLRLVRRRPPNVVVVALANKMARTIWALLAHDRAYEPNFARQSA